MVFSMYTSLYHIYLLLLYICTGIITRSRLMLYDSFWSYEYSKRLMPPKNEGDQAAASTVLLCGGIAGVATWASVFPLDVIKTRLQAETISNDNQQLQHPERRRQQQQTNNNNGRALRFSSVQLAKDAYRAEGIKPFYRGLGVCSVRAFIVNAVQVFKKKKKKKKRKKKKRKHPIPFNSRWLNT